MNQPKMITVITVTVIMVTAMTTMDMVTTMHMVDMIKVTSHTLTNRVFNIKLLPKI